MKLEERDLVHTEGWFRGWHECGLCGGEAPLRSSYHKRKLLSGFFVGSV